MPPEQAIPLSGNPDVEQHATFGQRRWLGAMTAPRATWTALRCLFHGNGSKTDENISQANAQSYPSAKSSSYPRHSQTNCFAHHHVPTLLFKEVHAEYKAGNYTEQSKVLLAFVAYTQIE